MTTFLFRPSSFTSTPLHCLAVANLCAAMVIIPNNNGIASSARHTPNPWLSDFLPFCVCVCGSVFLPVGRRRRHHHRLHRHRRCRRCYVRAQDSRLIAIRLLKTINYCDKKWKPSSPRK